VLVGTRHTGIVVSDIELSLEFFIGIGYRVVSREVESGLTVSKIVGIPEVRIDIAKLRAPDESMIELLQYLSHPDLGESYSQPSNKLGCSHIALSVKSIDHVSRKIVELGGSLVDEPVLSVNGAVLVCYCHSPFGVLMELVEEVQN